MFHDHHGANNFSEFSVISYQRKLKLQSLGSVHFKPQKVAIAM